MREFSKGGANVHVKAHYRILNGKMVYVHDHDKLGAAVGHEAQLHERVQQSKSAKGTHTLMSIDPEDRDAVLKHAEQMGLKPEVKYQGGKIRDHEGNVKAHGFYYAHFQNEEDAKKVHASLSAKVDPGEKPSDNVDDYAPETNDIDASTGMPSPEEDAASLKKQAEDEAKNDEEADATVEASSDKTVDDAFQGVMDFVKQHSAGLVEAAESDEKDPEKLKDALAKTEELIGKLEKVVDLAPDGGVLAKTSNEAISKWLDRRESIQKKLGQHPSQQGDTPAEALPELDEKPNAQATMAGHINEANTHFGMGNHEGALASLKSAHELASKHGLKHVGDNGKEYDANWMQGKINALEGAKPQTESGTQETQADSDYKTAAAAATNASIDANQMTETNVDSASGGKHGPENAMNGKKDHESAMLLHEAAQQAHHVAYNKATTPELKEHHGKKANEHAAKAKLHHQVAMKHHGQMKANDAADAYADASSKADQDSIDADGHIQESEFADHHHNAASWHEKAALSHKNAVVPAIDHEAHANPKGSGSELANKHALASTAHDKKAAYHKAAEKAWDLTNHGPEDQEGHVAAAGAHEHAAQLAEKAGYKTAAEKHKLHQGNHETKANPQKAESDETKHAYATSQDANDWSSHPMNDWQSHNKAADAHKAAGSAHVKAGQHAHDVMGDTEQGEKHEKQASAHHDKRVYHSDASDAWKSSDAAEQFAGSKTKLTAQEHKDAYMAHAVAEGDHSTARHSAEGNMTEAHVQQHASQQAHHSEMVAKHKQWHKEALAEKAADEADDAASTKPTVTTNHKPEAKQAGATDWAQHDPTEIGNKGHEAAGKGDHAEAVKHYKHAAIVAHHKGFSGDAQTWASHAKAHMEMLAKKNVQKAVDPKVLRMSIYETTRKLLQESSEPRNFSKAVDKLPSAIRLQQACTEATKQGITGVEEIVNVAAGGKKQGAPILAFLSDLKQ
jgi:hypothetical protein